MEKQKIVLTVSRSMYEDLERAANAAGSFSVAEWMRNRIPSWLGDKASNSPLSSSGEVRPRLGRPPKPKTFMDDLSGTEKRALLIDSNDAGERCEGSLQRLEIPDWEKSTFPFLMCPFCNNRSLICVRLKDGSGTAVMREHLVGVKGEEWGPVENYGVITEREKHDRDLLEGEDGE